MKSQLLLGVVICLVVTGLLFSWHQVYSQSGPITNANTVTATVPDIYPPSAPILVAPADDSLLTTKSPDFVWEESTDNVGVVKYQLYIDDTLYQDDIPVTTTSTGSYTLTYDALEGEYTLSDTNYNLDEGLHEWYIVAYDAAGLNTSSTTWEFTVDTVPPTFVITYVDTTNTNISAANPDSVPDDPIELDTNEPVLVGVGEANSSVILLIEYESLGDELYSFSIGSDGTWSISLPVLPRDEEILLTFTITDQAGFTSTLTDVPITLSSPPTPTSTPTKTPTPTPTPTLTLVASPSASLTPTGGVGGVDVTSTPSPDDSSGGEATPTPSGATAAPVGPTRRPIDPIDVINKVEETGPLIVRRLEQLQFFSSADDTPQVIRSLDADPVLETREAVTALPILTVLLLQLLAIASHLSHTLSPRSFFEFGTLIEILRVLGIIPREKPYGIVFESLTQKPASYATVVFEGTNWKKQKIKVVKITDKEGIYGKPNLEDGTYRACIEYEKHLFPTLLQREPLVPWDNFYKGEEFIVKNGKEPSLFIPIDINTRVHDPEHLSNTVRSAEKKMLTFNPLSNRILILNFVLAFLFPSIINAVIFLGHVAIFAFRVIRNRQPNFTGKVITKDDKPLEQVAIKVIDSSSLDLVTLGQTEDDGSFVFVVPQGAFHLSLHLHEYTVTQTTEGSPDAPEDVLVSVGPESVYETVIMERRTSK